MIDFIQVQEWCIMAWPIITSAVTTASMITAITPTPKDDNIIKKIYKGLEIVALVIGRAKEK